MKDYEGITKATYPRAVIAQTPWNVTDWYIKKDPTCITCALCIVGSGKSPENAWKSAVRRIRKASGG